MSEATDHDTADVQPQGNGERPADTPTPTQDNTRAVAVVPRQRIVSTSDVAIWDTAAFEHMGRVGSLMASAQMASPTIYDGVDHAGAVSRMVMIANLARECGANPLMFLQGCSIISNKLHLEGKTVNAIIRARTGIRLRFRFGVWDAKLGEIAFPEKATDAAFFRGAGENLAVRVDDPAQPDDFVDGYVGLWKTDRKGSPWSNPANWRRQLRYRGAPEWARAYEPGAVLGFYSDADEDVGEMAAPTGPKPRRGTAEKLAAGSGGDQVNTEEVRAATTAAGGEADDATDAEFTDASGDADETSQDAGEADQGDGGADGPLKASDNASAEEMTMAVQLAKIAPMDESPEEVLDRIIAARQAGQVVENGHAEADETYLLAGLAPNAEGKFLTFKNGARFSTKGKVDGLKVYAIHAPEPAAEEEGEDPTSATADTATGGAQAAEAEPDTSAPVTDASADGAGQAAGSGPSTPAEGGEVGDEGGFLASLRGMNSWLQIKPAFIAMNKTTDWMAADEYMKDEVRRAVWAEVERVRADHGDPVDQASDVSAFGIWLATQSGRDGADAAAGTLNALKGQPAWAKLKPEQHATLEARVVAFIKSVKV